MDSFSGNSHGLIRSVALLATLQLSSAERTDVLGFYYYVITDLNLLGSCSKLCTLSWAAICFYAYFIITAIVDLAVWKRNKVKLP